METPISYLWWKKLRGYKFKLYNYVDVTIILLGTVITNSWKTKLKRMHRDCYAFAICRSGDEAHYMLRHTSTVCS